MTDIVGDTPITLRGISGLLAAVPHSLGFHPTNSIVLMCFTGRHQLGPVARFDLPRGRDHELAHQLVGTAAMHAEEVAVICYPRNRRRPPLIDDVLDGIDACGLGLMAAAIVHAGRVWPALGQRTLRLADSEPAPDQDHPAMRTLAARHALEGRAVLADREQLRASIAGPRGRRRRLAEQAISDTVNTGRRSDGDHGRGRPTFGPVRVPGVPPLSTRMDRLLDDALEQVARTGEVDVGVAAELAVAVTDRTVRDGVLVRGLLELDRSWVSMLISCATWTPDWLAADICSLLGAIAFRHGDGALGQVAADRCLHAEPGHRLTHLLISTMSAGMPPAVLDGLLTPPDVDDPDRRSEQPGDGSGDSPGGADGSRGEGPDPSGRDDSAVA